MSTALFTDLYESTMAQSFLEHHKTGMLFLVRWLILILWLNDRVPIDAFGVGTCFINST